MSDTDVLDTLLRLGRQIRAAAQADEWARASELIDRRGEMVQKLPSEDEEDPSISRMERKKLEALAAQNESLAQLFRGRREEIEDELAEIGDLRRAQNSYQQNSTRDGVLHSKLTG